MIGSHVRRTVEIGDSAGDLDDPMIGASRKGQALGAVIENFSRFGTKLHMDSEIFHIHLAVRLHFSF